MRPQEVRELLESVRSGQVSVEEGVTRLQALPVDDLGFARLDTHRELRQGFGEAVYGAGKTPAQLVAITKRALATTSGPVLVTRVTPEGAEALLAAHPSAVFHEAARLLVLRSQAPAPGEPGLGTVLVVCAGTSDLPVADEAAAAAETWGARVERLTDVGVAGLHRILGEQDRLHSADVIICVAGMEGALASLVGGISSAPVVAVPTSVGYGAAFGGLAALLAMLNACATGIAVTNIDGGFSAAAFAVRLLRSRRA
jgi:pyridinium-3,5-biscarboxylic acid mononucleotide synthase